MPVNTQAQEGIIVGFSASSGVIQPKTNFNEELSSNFEPVSFVIFCLLRHTGPILDNWAIGDSREKLRYWSTVTIVFSYITFLQ